MLDFGVSRAMNDLEQEIPPASRPAAGLRVLFPSYAAPEQLDATVGKLGAWTDVYALALLFMELLSDRPVVSGQETGALVERVLDEHRRPTPQTHGLELPRNLDLVLTRAVARVPSRRQKTATDLWNDVKTSLRGATSRGFVAPKVPVRPAPPHTEPESPAGPPSVAGAVPARRVLVPETSNETIPMGFPIPGAGPTYVPKPVPVPVSPSAPISAAIPLQSPLPQPAIELEIDLPPVHVLTTPLPPHADTPALPPVMVTMDTPPQMPALPPPGPRFEPPPVRMPAAPTFVILDAAPPRRKGSAVVWITVAAALVGGSLGVALVVALKRHPAALAPAPPAASSAPGEAPGQVVPPPSPSGAAPPPSAAPSSTAPGPPSNVEPTAHFPALAARAALEAASHEIAHCRR
ncbi:MAG TPA: hypothetical protein VIF09_07570, partial [Polyangiaceae bacterium]